MPFQPGNYGEVYAQYINLPGEDYVLPSLMGAAVAGAFSGVLGIGENGGALLSALGNEVGLLGILGDDNPDDVPNATLNYMFFGENFEFDPTMDSGFDFTAITGAAEANDWELLTLQKVADRKGYLFIYVANETPGEKVWFDDLKITHIEHPVVQTDDYYPFGLAFNSYQSGLKNDYLFNQGTGEKTFKTERLPELGWDMTKFRAYDYTLGRFIGIDPLADVSPQESLTPYQYAYNNPVLYNDPYGDCPWCAVIGAAIDIGLQATEIYLDDNKTIDDFSVTSVLVSAAAGAVGVGLATKVSQIAKVAKLGKVASTALKVVSEVTVDATASSAGQLARDGEVSPGKVAIDVLGSQTIGKALGDAAKSRASNSSTGKQLQQAVNQEKNIARGKSNTTPKSRANVAGAEKKLTGFKESRAVGASAASSGIVSTGAELLMKINKEKLPQ